MTRNNRQISRMYNFVRNDHNEMFQRANLKISTFDTGEQGIMTTLSTMWLSLWLLFPLLSEVF